MKERFVRIQVPYDLMGAALPANALRVGMPVRVVHDPEYAGVESTIYYLYETRPGVMLTFAPQLVFLPENLEVIRGDY